MDAQAGALANRVRRATELLATQQLTTGPSGYAAVLAEMATLHTLTVAGRRTARAGRGSGGERPDRCRLDVAREEVLATPPTTDHWHVVARSDTEEHRITVRRTWLLGRRSGRWGLLLDFAAFGESLADDPAVGTVLYADLHHFPARVPLRALVGVVHEPAEEDVTGPPASTVAGTLADAGWAIAREPWLERWPAVVLATPRAASSLRRDGRSWTTPARCRSPGRRLC